MNQGEILTASVNVTNVGATKGKEIVQLYIRDSKSHLVRPLKELKGFEKIELQPGETQVVNFEIQEDALKYYDDRLGTWIAESGTFELFIGGSSHDLQVAGRFEWIGNPDGLLDYSSRLNIGLPIGVLLEDAEGRKVLEKHLGLLIENPMIGRFHQRSLEEIAPHTEGVLTSDVLQRINADLARV